MNKKQSSGMTRKEALAVLHKLRDAVGWHLYDSTASEEDKLLKGQIYDAFHTLDRAFHGERARYSHSLCNVCYLRLASDYSISSPGDRGSLKRFLHTSCCLECLAHIRADKRDMLIEQFDYEQGKFVIVERVSSEEDEVQV